MARRTPLDRLDRLVDVATDVLIDRGYRRTQMADVAAAMGVAKGTLYLAVTGKEALFDLVIRFADGPRPIPPLPLPVPTPPPGATLELVRQEIIRQQAPPALTAALSRSRPGDARDEVSAIAGELFDTLSANRRRVKLADRAAVDWPEMAALWLDGARGGLVGLLAQLPRGPHPPPAAPPRARRAGRGAAIPRDVRVLGRAPALGPAPAQRGRCGGARHRRPLPGPRPGDGRTREGVTR